MNMPEEKCDRCGKMFDMDQIGYIGPADFEDDSCHPFMEMLTVCEGCLTEEDRKKMEKMVKRDDDE